MTWTAIRGGMGEGGGFASVDNGQTWRAANRVLPPDASVVCLLADEGSIYAATEQSRRSR